MIVWLYCLVVKVLHKNSQSFETHCYVCALFSFHLLVPNCWRAFVSFFLNPLTLFFILKISQTKCVVIISKDVLEWNKIFRFFTPSSFCLEQSFDFFMRKNNIFVDITKRVHFSKKPSLCCTRVWVYAMRMRKRN